MLLEIEWGVIRPTRPHRDPRGSAKPSRVFDRFNAFIEQRPALDRGAISTDRSDNTVLLILDPLAISDEHLFRWGDPPHVYSIKAVDGIVQDEESGTRYASEVTVIR